MRIILALMLALLPVSPALAQAIQTTPSERLAALNDVVDAVVNGRPAEALDLVDPVLDAYEKDYGKQGGVIICSDDSPQALEALGAAQTATGKTVIAIDLGWCIALWAKGYALVDLHRIQESLPYLERAAAMMPYNSQYLSELGNAYQELGQYDKALAVFTRSAEAAKRTTGSQRTRWLTRAWRGMGFSLIELGRWDEAEALYRQCLELDPSDAKAKNELAYIRQNRPKR